MAITLIVETGAGLSNANTFNDSAGVTTVLAANPFASAWSALTPDQQDQMCVESTQWLNRLAWDGVATVMTQALVFPRYGLQTRDGYPVLVNVLPAFLLQAHARVCLFLSQQTDTPFADTGLVTDSRLTVGPIALTPITTTRMPPDVRALLAPYVRNPNVVARA